MKKLIKKNIKANYKVKLYSSEAVSNNCSCGYGSSCGNNCKCKP